MSEFVDWYEILQVHPSAEPEVIKGAYDKLAKKYHPDLNKDPAATERMKQINLAYEVLGEPEKRRLFDLERHQRQSKADPGEARAQADPVRPSSPAPPQRQLKGWGKWVVGTGFGATAILLIWGLVVLGKGTTPAPVASTSSSFSTSPTTQRPTLPSGLTSAPVATPTITPTASPTGVPTPTVTATPAPAPTSVPTTPAIKANPTASPTLKSTPSVPPTPTPTLTWLLMPTPTPKKPIPAPILVGVYGQNVQGVAMSDDGSFTAGISRDGLLLFVNREGKLLWTFQAGPMCSDRYSLNSLALSPDGSYVAAAGCSPERDIFLLNQQGKMLWKYPWGKFPKGLAVTSDGLVVIGDYAAFDRQGRLLCQAATFSQCEALKSLGVQSDPIRQKNLSGNGALSLGFQRPPGRLRVVKDPGKSQEILIWTFGTGVATAAFTANGDYIAAVDGGAVYLLDIFGKVVGKYGGGDVFDIAISADGSYVAVASAMGLYLFRSPSHLTPLAQTPALSSLPSSVIGRVGFVSSQGNIWTIYTVDTDGSNLQPLNKHPASKSQPAWSPDGKSVAFVSADNRIFIIDIAGSNIRALTNMGNGTQHKPVWSPDGKSIAFYYVSTDSPQGIGIYIVAADGSGLPRPLIKDPAWKGVDPSWSPDGKSIAFTSSRYGYSQVFAIDADGSNGRRLTYDPTEKHSPAWSPDGSKIAFVSYEDANNEIYIIDADGSNQRRLTYTKNNEGYPAWSPDGKQIAFHAQDSGNVSEIYIMDADGSNVRRLTTTEGQNYNPVWLP